MDDIGSEISQKIRAAIKAKLVELGAFIDNELPDYVMIMVANKRTRQQMNDDLELFLGRNTKIFTGWLQSVVQKLQEVTVSDFDPKLDEEKSKGEKRKRSKSEGSGEKEGNAPDDQNKSGKKRPKKVKGGKKPKKSKHKSKGKKKDKEPKEKEESTEAVGNDDKQGKEGESSQAEEAQSASGNNKDKVTEKDEQNVNDSSVPKVPEKDKDANSENEEEAEESSSTGSSSSSHSSNENVKDDREEEEQEDDDVTMEGEKDEEMEDESIIDPLRENEYQSDEKSDDKPNSYKSESQNKPTETTYRVPTRELLKQHNRMYREMEGNYGKRRKRSDQNDDTEEYEESRRSGYRRSRRGVRKIVFQGKTITLPPDFDIFNFCSRTRVDASLAALRAKRICQRRDHDIEEDEEDEESEERLRYSPLTVMNAPKDNTESAVPSTSEPKSNIVSISKSLEMEKNLGVSNDEEKTSENKKSVSSKICTIPEPEEPEIPSVIQVKPREFLPKEKQANKTLLLKAVADAEKSVATAPTRNDNDIESKKSEGQYGKNLKGKKFEKLAVTLSNVQADDSDADRVKAKKVITTDPEDEGDAQDSKSESLKYSELSHEAKSVPDVTLKNISNKSEDQFVSSKTSAMEKNDRYIHCWLEGVEKAVKDDEIVNPSDMDTYPVSYSGEEKDDYIPSTSSEELEEEEEVDEEEDMEEVEEEEEMEEGEELGPEEVEEAEDVEAEEMEDEYAQSGQPYDMEEESYEEEQSEEKMSDSTKGNEDECVDIVVTLDGLTSKTVKHVSFRYRDATNGPLSSSSNKDDAKDDNMGETEEGQGIRYKVDSPIDAGTSKQSDGDCAENENEIEKISDRFGRINKASVNHEFKEKYYKFERERYEKKCEKYRGTDKEDYYKKLKEKYASPRASKSKKLISRSSQKFSKVDRELEESRRRYWDDELIKSYYERDDDEDKGTGYGARYNKRNRNSRNQSKP